MNTKVFKNSTKGGLKVSFFLAKQYLLGFELGPSENIFPNCAVHEITTMYFDSTNWRVLYSVIFLKYL